MTLDINILNPLDWYFRLSTVLLYIIGPIFQVALYFMIYYRLLINLVGRVFTYGPRDIGSIPGCVIPKTLKMVLDASLLNTQQYKVRISTL